MKGTTIMEAGMAPPPQTVQKSSEVQLLVFKLDKGFVMSIGGTHDSRYGLSGSVSFTDVSHTKILT